MDASAQTSLISGVLAALGGGLPHLLPRFLVALALLVVGALIYFAITPLRERAMMAQGNTAGGAVLAGTILGLAIPIAATLATTAPLIDIVVWGAVALIIQLVVYAVMSLALHGLRRQIEAGNMAAAVAFVGTQIAVALLMAATMVPV
jgi:putative membrane protein